MAQMVPPTYDESTRSSAERRLFERLQRDPDTEGWVVLHSLGLSERSGRPYGEIDFVVIVPGGGLLCLEVKGGRVSCTDGVWSVLDRRGAMHRMRRSPFMQAREGMFALREALVAHFGEDHDVSRMPIGYAVFFPDSDAPPTAPEFEPWEVADRRDLMGPVSHTLRKMLRAQRRRLGGRCAEGSPTPTLVREVRQFLRPDFEVVVARSAQIGRTEEKLLRLEQEQYDVLNRLHENPRCFIRGAAGTGKTVLAVEYARRAARSGARVLLTCYNRMLGDWLRGQFAGTEGVVAGSYHRLMREVILSTSFAEEFLEEERRDTPALFEETYPFYGELAASEAEAFDVVVLDEAQDLAHAQVLSVLNAHLRGGFAGGRWALFGDFSRQAIYSSSASSSASANRSTAVGNSSLDKYAAHYAREHLTTNYRNTRQIGEETALLSGFSEPPYRFCRVEGLAVDYRYWRGERQADALSRVLQQYLDEGTPAADIVVLSPIAFERSVAGRLKDAARYRITDSRGTVARCAPASTVGSADGVPAISFCTVHAFKGMESPVVVLCDISHVDDHEPQALLYVGMSRARSHLTVLLHEQARPSLTRLTTRKLQAEWSAPRY